MATLQLEQVCSKLKLLLSHQSTPETIALWATEMHLRYERGDLMLENGKENAIFNLLVNIIHNEDQAFRIPDTELAKIVSHIETMLQASAFATKVPDGHLAP
jgi:hypothetical protein